MIWMDCGKTDENGCQVLLVLNPVDKFINNIPLKYPVKAIDLLCILLYSPEE
jgi:hypothetical protein